MTILKIKGKEYKLKFGYKSFKKSGILREVVSMRNKMGSNDEDGEGIENLEMLEEMLEVNSKLVLAALQKHHEEFRTDYKSEEEVREIVDRIDDLLDDYMDEEESMSIIELFTTLTDELFNNGFLSKKSDNLEEMAEKMDATVIPTDHKMSEN